MIISTDTTWRAYQVINLTSDVQVAAGVKLTIEQGAVINGNNFQIQAFGTVTAHGTVDDMVSFNQVNFTFGSFYNTPGSINLLNCSISKGAFLPATGYGSYGKFSVIDSVFENVNGFYIWYPTSDSAFTGNIFYKCTGQQILLQRGVALTIKENSFTEQYGSAISVLADYGKSLAVYHNSFSLHEYKSFINSQNFGALAIFKSYPEAYMNAYENYFGTIDPNLIEKLIIDRSDGLEYFSYINYADSLSAPYANTPIAGTSSNDLIVGGSSANRLYGFDGNDQLDGGAGDDRLYGGVGNDTLIGGAGNDRLDGGDGIDIASFAGLTAGVEIDLSNFSGTITSALGTDSLISIEGLIGGSGDDVLKAGATATYLDGGAGTDFLGGSAFDDTLIGGDGNDGLAGGDGNDSLDGGDGDDTLLGQAGDDTISGGIGRDFIDGGDGIDTVNAGDANDLINGGNGNDVINGDAGNDSIYGDAGNDVIDGGAGDDDLSGGNDNDTVNGGVGDDRIAGGFGNDILNGGDGNDTISANDGDDTITGGLGVDNLYGFTGNDTIDGGDGGDTLLGMEGDDTVTGGAGADYIVGGDGTDTLDGDDGDDNMQGNDGNDTLNGGLGNDGLDGGAGNDTLNGDAGNDYFGGGEGNDILNGGDGNDVFVGGVGLDTLTGGAGADAFFFTAATDSTSAAIDRITDFSWVDGDYIDLSRIDANTSAAGDQAFSFVNSFTKQAGQATLSYDAASNTSTFSADVDGDGVADFVLQVNGQQNTGQGWVL